MPKFLLSVHHDYTKPLFDDPAEQGAMTAATGEFNVKLKAAGEYVFAHGLEAPSAAKVVDGRRGKAIVTDGPYLESKEAIGGFWILELPNLEAALARAAEGSAACRGLVEVRPFHSE